MISICWNMIIKDFGHTEEIIGAVGSLQGLYDYAIIAVDDGAESDNIYNELQYFPNTQVYRQAWWKMKKRYDLARIDVLNKVPDYMDYIGWSDADEFLADDTYDVRKWIVENDPEAINFGIRYLYPVGGHEAGGVYPRPKMWKKGTRVWARPCHETPWPPDAVDSPFIFDHVKKDNSEYAADHCIHLMQQEIDNGDLGWVYFQGREYRIKGDSVNAKQKCLDYLTSGETEFIDNALILVGELFLEEKDFDGLISYMLNVESLSHPRVYEYIAIAHYWMQHLELARAFHQMAKALDTENKYPYLIGNNTWLGE